MSAAKKKSPLRRAGSILYHIVFFLLLFGTFSLIWVQMHFANISVEEIIFHLRMPLEGTSSSLVRSFMLTSLLPALILFAVKVATALRPSRYADALMIVGRKRTLRVDLSNPRVARTLRAALCLCWALILVLGLNHSYGLVAYIRNLSTPSTFIAEEYVDPRDVRLTFPEKKRNLITIFVESGETTIQDVESGGLLPFNYIPEMTRIAEENVSFSQSRRIDGAMLSPGAGWTIAALFAETTGLPLKIGINLANTMDGYGAFVPGAYSLGEILEEAGYHNFFLAGSDFTFGGRTNYFTQHGQYEIWDYDSALSENRLPEPDYYAWWGFEDQKLYAFAQEKLTALAAAGEPFNFSMLTADTHHIDGYVCELCEDVYDYQYANVWACASRQLDGFLRWIQAQDFYENTTVVIYGDHPSMQPNFFDEEMSGLRHVYNAIVNSAVETERETNRLFTTLDFFPTTLASLGVTIEGDRLGLGVNLFSGTPTLSELYGYSFLMEELEKRSVFYEKELLFAQGH